MDDYWEDRAEESLEQIELAIDRLKFVEMITFDGDDAEKFRRAFWDLRSLAGKLERQLDEEE